MSWLAKLREKPMHTKMIIMWGAVGACAAVLLIIWGAVGNYSNKAQKDTSIFKTIGNSLKNVSKQDIAGQARQQTLQQQQQEQPSNSN